jgi:hypothetical protein
VCRSHLCFYIVALNLFVSSSCTFLQLTSRVQPQIKAFVVSDKPFSICGHPADSIVLCAVTVSGQLV